MAPADSSGMSKQRLDRVHEALKQEVEQGKLAGTVVWSLARASWSTPMRIGFQDKEEGKPRLVRVVPHLFDDKALVSVAAMMLVEEGNKSSSTDPVSKFLPPFKGQQVSVARTDAEFARVTYSWCRWNAR